MAATAVASSFSSSMHTLKCMRSRRCASDPHNAVLKFSPPAMLSSISISHPYTIEHVSMAAVSNKWPRFLRISAAVAQEEAAATAAEAPVEVVEEEEEVKEGNGDGETETETEAKVAVNTKLYFGNLPYNVDSAQLAGMIQEYANPELVEVLYDRETGRSRGFAFVTMSTVEDCNAVIENLDGRECLGRTLRVNLSDKPRPKLPLYAETEYKLFVGNLSWSVTTESLTEAFKEYGNVVGARVLYDGETGRSRGYGFICYSTKEEMDTALESLNGVELEGRALRVSLAQGRRS